MDAHLLGICPKFERFEVWSGDVARRQAKGFSIEELIAGG